MDLNRMLDKCERGQWRTEDLDWSRKPAAMTPEKERAVVQYFTDMAGIERLAAALFEEQQVRAEDPVLARIFATFVEDEKRHARCAELLAAHYDVRKLQIYRQNDELRVFGHHFVEALRHVEDEKRHARCAEFLAAHYDVRKLQIYRQNDELRVFGHHFVEALRHVEAEVATVYVTVGELLLDVALLRSIDAYVDDPMSSEVMERINRDESRHIAMDFHMTEYYASDAYQEWLARQPGKTLREHAAAIWALGHVLRHARPFLRAIFLEPMERVDPSGRRIAEAFARYQALIERPRIRTRPLPAIIHGTQWLARHEATKTAADRVARTMGIPKQLLRPAEARA